MSKPIFWTPQREAQYRTDWLTMTDKDLSEKYGMSVRSIGNVNHRLKLTNGKGRLTWNHRHSKYEIGEVVTYVTKDTGQIVKYLMTEEGRERIRSPRKRKVKTIVPKIKPQPVRQARIKPEKKIRVVVPKKAAPVKKPVFMPPRRVEKIFKTIEQDLSKLITVRLDSKTTAHVKPGTDIEAVKARYKKAS
jgi:hypothetical protein